LWLEAVVEEAVVQILYVVVMRIVTMELRDAIPSASVVVVVRRPLVEMVVPHGQEPLREVKQEVWVKVVRVVSGKMPPEEEEEEDYMAEAVVAMTDAAQVLTAEEEVEAAPV
jgi:hypothetical protein